MIRAPGKGGQNGVTAPIAVDYLTIIFSLCPKEDFLIMILLDFIDSAGFPSMVKNCLS